MTIDEQTLDHLEKLAKLTVASEQRSLTLQKIAGILNILDRVDMNDITDLEPLYHPLEISQPLREDKSQPYIERDSMQTQAPDVANGLFLVPSVIE